MFLTYIVPLLRIYC